jgi:hypothetical protein
VKYRQKRMFPTYSSTEPSVSMTVSGSGCIRCVHIIMDLPPKTMPRVICLCLPPETMPRVRREKTNSMHDVKGFTMEMNGP